MKKQAGNTRYVSALFIMLLMTGFNMSWSQTCILSDSPQVKGTTVVIPGIEYKRSGYHRFFWGSHYRDVWTTPVRVENFFLDTALGGLTTVKEGGGRQSKNLRLKDKQGKEYVLRSVNKDFGRGLPATMQGTFMSKIAKDQVSIGHPYAAYTITPMIRAAGIYHTRPRMVFVPRQPALEEYSDEYGNQLYMFEERPDEDQRDAAHFGFSENVVGSEKMFEKTYEDHDNLVDQAALVRARLFDMFIGDWGRHPDNWRWAEFEKGKQTLFRPVPRDRDQAYTKIDGFYPDLIASLPGLRHIQGFGKTIRNTGAWNFPGHKIDKRFLNELPLQTWISQARDLQRILTDSLIESSIRLMPPQWFTLTGESIIASLKSRRNDLERYAREYYAYLAKTVTVLGSDKREEIQLQLLPDKKVNLHVFKINKEGIRADTPYYARVFDPVETKQLYIYGLGKQDLVKVGGYGRSRIFVRIIDPEREDSIMIAKKPGKVNFFLGKKFEYDTLRQNKIKVSILPVLTPAPYLTFDWDPLELFPRTGIKVSGGIVFTPQPWRKKEFQMVHSLHALHGFLRKSFNAGYVGRFGHIAGRWDLVLKGRLDAPAVKNYFGTGNKTRLESNRRNFYRTFSHLLYGSVGVERQFRKMHHAELALVYQSVRYHKSGKHFNGGLNLIDPSAYNRKQFGGFQASYKFDQTNGNIYPTRGFLINVGGGYLKNLANNDSSFLKINTNASVYIPLSRSFTFAFRAGGGTVLGEADFYHLNRLGGNTEMRGYERERFYGNRVFYTNSEVRWIRNTRNFFFNGRAGLFGFCDIGRVWMHDEFSRKWHPGYGMGIILIPYNKVTLTGMYGLSDEGANLFFRAEMFF